MEPVRPKEVEGLDRINYRGSGEVGDLYVHRLQPGYILSYWRPSHDELGSLNEGGAVVIHTHCEPIPPMSVTASGPQMLDALPNRFRNVPELDDQERR